MSFAASSLTGVEISKLVWWFSLNSKIFESSFNRGAHFSSHMKSVWNSPRIRFSSFSYSARGLDPTGVALF